jgi:hypothetical protein
MYGKICGHGQGSLTDIINDDNHVTTDRVSSGRPLATKLGGGSLILFHTFLPVAFCQTGVRLGVRGWLLLAQSSDRNDLIRFRLVSAVAIR